MILAIASVLAAGPMEAPVATASARDCAVIAAVAREHLGLDKKNGPPLLPSGDYLPSCAWERLGVKPFAALGTRRNYWLRFGRPVYAGTAARIQVGVMHATRSGHGDICTLRLKGRAWQLIDCRRRWAS
ncbi:hypothetical protein IC614_11085 [Allosphingosinicella flava]|uniref:Uncharacterized protein n=1 Tax=Allosphingosinicella flava TaxID=2771430 RepID=A0A7T2LLW3_9SPHN|nr:hypothetical protein [Sphingosinicella flava]QPQ54849.1 hypothetical protein IC614_11085 [Sphingosinicella flava]